MLIEQTLFRLEDQVADAVALLRNNEPPEGYYLAFSGGKDSLVLKHLCDQAGVKYDAHYSVTTVDPPELVKYIRAEHPDVIFNRPKMSMFQLIPKKLMPPTRIVRYCCEYLKEHDGDGRFKLTGIRREESVKRAKRPMIQAGMMHPIFHWSEYDVWEYIDKYNLKYCSLYDTGKSRIGCIMCPMQGAQGMLRDAEIYHKFYNAYLNAFKKMLVERNRRGLKTEWRTPEDVMDWWIYGSSDTIDGGLF
jgi:phosphoadenosine phosphosulfate reductase